METSSSHKNKRETSNRQFVKKYTSSQKQA